MSISDDKNTLAGSLGSDNTAFSVPGTDPNAGNASGSVSETDESTVYIDLDSDTHIITTPVELGDLDTPVCFGLPATDADTKAPRGLSSTEATHAERDEAKNVVKKRHKRRKNSGKGWILWTLAAVVVAGGAITAVHFLLGIGNDAEPKPIDPEQSIAQDVTGASADVSVEVQPFDEVSNYTYGQAIYSATNQDIRP